jgi:hypothetical protein
MEMMELVLNQTSSKFLCENEQNQKFFKSKKLVSRFHQRFHKKKKKKKRLNLQPKVLFEIKNQTTVVCTLYHYFYFYLFFLICDGDHPQANLAKKNSINNIQFFLNPKMFSAIYLLESHIEMWLFIYF